MNGLRLCLACVWLIFAAVAPAHAAAMNPVACERMPMPHGPMHHFPGRDESAMPCCSVPAAVAAEAVVLLPERAVVFVKRAPAPVHKLSGTSFSNDPPPPKTFEV